MQSRKMTCAARRHKGYMDDIMRHAGTLTCIVLLLAVHLPDSSLRDTTRSDATVYEYSRTNHGRMRRSVTYDGANGLNLISDTKLAMAYQAHVCSWSCFRDNFTQQLPDKIVQSATLRVSCIDCFCDEDCVAYGDCCGSFGGSTTSHYDTSQTPLRQKYECLPVAEYDGVYVISSCPEVDHQKRTKRVKKISQKHTGNHTGLNHLAGAKDQTATDVNGVRKKCHSCLPDSVQLITVANKTYCNKFCLQCNEGRHLRKTDLMWKSQKTTEYQKPPNAVVRPCDIRYKSTRSSGQCSVDRTSANLTAELEELLIQFQHLCDSFRAPILFNVTLFDNIFCCLCHILRPSSRHRVNMALLTDLSGLSRSLRSPRPRHGGRNDRIDESGKGQGEDGVRHSDGQCQFGYRRFHEKGACRKILCVSGRNLSVDNHSSVWTCTPAERGSIQGFRLRAVWRVLIHPSSTSAVDTGQKKAVAEESGESSREFHVTGRKGETSVNWIDNIDEKRQEEDKLDLWRRKRFNGSGQHVSREQPAAAHVTPDEIYDHLITIIRRSVCGSVSARDVSRFCFRACREQNYREHLEGQDCFFMNDCASVGAKSVKESFSQKKEKLKEKESFQQMQREDKDVFPLPWKHEEATDGVAMGNYSTKGRQGKKSKHAKSIRETSGQVAGIEGAVLYVNGDLVVIAEPNSGIDILENILLTDFLGVKRLDAFNYSMDVEVALVSSGQKDAPLETCSRGGHSAEKLDDDDDRLVQLTAVSACAHVRLNLSEVNFTGGGELIVEELNATLYRYQYFNDSDDAILVCAKTLDEASVSAETVRADAASLLSRVETVLTIVSLSVSFVCLVVTLTTYCAIPALRSMPGKNNMVLVASLLAAQVLLIAADFPDPGTLMCAILGVALHYSWLSTVVWMSACSFHMFHVFVIHQATPSTSRPHWSYLVRYLAVTHTVSAVAVLAVVISSLYWSAGETPGYGNHVCYLDTTLLVALGFILPLSVVVVTNVGLFGVTIYTISRLENVKKHTKREQKNVHVYLRLSALTGISWALALIAEIPGLEFLRCVSIIVNGSQGLLIFLSYICNRRALNLWKNVISKGSSSDSRSSRNVTSTTSI